MRRKRLNLLIYLSALSAVALYVVQGALATGADVTAFPAWFWVLDLILWAFRAVIEASVIVYLFSTQAQTKAQKRTLAVFELALIALITFTVGPALRAVGVRVSIADSLTPTMYTLWCYGIASYVPLMMGGAGYAFLVEGDDTEVVDEAALRAKITQAEQERDDVTRELAQLRAISPLLDALPQQTRAQLYKRWTGNGVKAADIAQDLSISKTSAQRGVTAVRKEMAGKVE